MDTYIAVLRLCETPSRHYLSSSVRAALFALPGVSAVDLDRPGRSLLVWFTRSRASLGDIVRAVEGQGLSVCGVAQSRDPSAAAAVGARPAIA